MQHVGVGYMLCCMGKNLIHDVSSVSLMYHSIRIFSFAPPGVYSWQSLQGNHHHHQGYTAGSHYKETTITTRGIQLAVTMYKETTITTRGIQLAVTTSMDTSRVSSILYTY